MLGSAITISGTRLSMAATPTDIVVGMSTQGLGAVIMSAFSGAPSSSVVAFEEIAAKRESSGVLVLGVELGFLYGLRLGLRRLV